MRLHLSLLLHPRPSTHTTGIEETWQIQQQQIVSAVEQGAARKAFDLQLPDLGPYCAAYTRAGRHMVLGGARGHLAVMEWQRGHLTCEVQVCVGGTSHGVVGCLFGGMGALLVCCGQWQKSHSAAHSCWPEQTRQSGRHCLALTHAACCAPTRLSPPPPPPPPQKVKETTRAVTFLHNELFFAAAQKKYVYIYDKRGLEVHCLREHVEPAALEFLPHHFLLTSVGEPGEPWAGSGQGRTGLLPPPHLHMCPVPPAWRPCWAGCCPGLACAGWQLLQFIRLNVAQPSLRRSRFVATTTTTSTAPK